MRRLGWPSADLAHRAQWCADPLASGPHYCYAAAKESHPAGALRLIALRRPRRFLAHQRNELGKTVCLAQIEANGRDR